MTLEPHHRAGRTRSWREDEAIGRWAAETRTPVPPAQGAPGAPNGAGPVARDAQPVSGPLSPSHDYPVQPDPEETP